jgi:hypothetical protein
MSTAFFRDWGKVFSIQCSVFRILIAVLLVLVPAGCVSKAKAKAQARDAFIAGQQETLRQMQQNQTPTVSILGQVNTPVVAWTKDLTLAQALIAASYTGRSDPSEILIVRRGVAIRVDPQKLLSGEDVPLQAGDVIQIKQ